MICLHLFLGWFPWGKKHQDKYCNKTEIGCCDRRSAWIRTQISVNIALTPPSNSDHYSGYWNQKKIKWHLVRDGWESCPASHTQTSGELHVSRPNSQYVPERPGDPLLFRVRLQPHHGAPPCSLGSSLLFWTKLPPNARFLDMDIKRILKEKEGRGMPGEEKKASYTTTICLRVGSILSASQSLRHTKLMGKIV